MKKDKWFYLTIISIIISVIIVIVIIFYRAIKFKEERDGKYGVENVLKIDTIQIAKERHEVLLINVKGEERIIHSPKCKCYE